MDVSLKKCQRRSSLGSESIQGSDLSKEHERANRLRREQIKREAKGKEKTVRKTKPVDYKAMPRIRSSTLPRPVRSTTNEMDFISHILRGPQNITQPDYTTDTSKSIQNAVEVSSTTTDELRRRPVRSTTNEMDFEMDNSYTIMGPRGPVSVSFITPSKQIKNSVEVSLKSTDEVYRSMLFRLRDQQSVSGAQSIGFTSESGAQSIGFTSESVGNITFSGATNFERSESGAQSIGFTSESVGNITFSGATNFERSESGVPSIQFTNSETSESNHKGNNIFTTDYVGRMKDLPMIDNITLSGATNFQRSESNPAGKNTSAYICQYLTGYSTRALNKAASIKTSELNFLSMEETKEDYEFFVMPDINFLPRYKYHRSLLDWFIGGLPEDPAFIECCFMDCSIIVGGNLSDEKKKQLFDEAPLLENMNLQTDSTALADVLVVYFYSGDVAQMLREITKLRNYHMFGKGTILVVTTTDYIDDMILKFTIVEKMKTLQITSVEFVDEIRSEIIKKITCILEPRLTEYLTQIKIKLLEHSSLTSNVRQSLLEVNAILRKLKRAACYLEPLAEDEDGEKTVDREIDEILQRFRDNILYQGYDGDKLYVITNDQSIKENLEAWFLESGIESLQLVITLEETLSTTELSKRGEPLNGAKFVYEHNSVGDFKEDMCYATIGCLMLTDDNKMVAVTCQHALEKKESFFTLINNAVVKLGKEKPQVNKQMARLYEDIALIEVDSETRNDINNYCERLLIDSCGEPSPAEIASESLKKGDIVHKWGATTGLTTGIVKEVKHKAIGRFTSACTVTFITGRDSEPFAKEGDSGALIFKHSESLEQNIIYIYGMVQSRLKVPFANAPIICSQFKESYDSLKNNLPDIQTLQFFTS